MIETKKKLSHYGQIGTHLPYDFSIVGCYWAEAYHVATQSADETYGNVNEFCI